MSKRSSRHLPEILAGVSAIIIAIMAFQIFSIRYPGEPHVSEVVTKFLDEIIVDEYNPSTALHIYPKYFVSLKDADIPEDAALMDYYPLEQDLFEQVFYAYVDGYKGYEIEAVTDEYAEISLVNLDGSYDYPKVGLWYTIRSGRIDRWRLARLQPFSVYNEEYSEDWNG